MKTKFAIMVCTVLMVSIFGLLIAPNEIVLKVKGQYNDPTLSDPDVYLDGDDVVFEVAYQDDDGDNGDVWVNFDWGYYVMQTTDLDPYTGQRYSFSCLKADLNFDTNFWFDAYDSQLAYGYLDNYGVDFLISDFITQEEWGYEPVLSNPNVYLSGDDVVFEVTYQHDNGSHGDVWLNFDFIDFYEMETTDLDPHTGQRYSFSHSKADLTLSTTFWFDAKDDQDEWAYLPMGYLDFLISDFISQEEWGDGGKEDNGMDMFFVMIILIAIIIVILVMIIIFKIKKSEIEEKEDYINLQSEIIEMEYEIQRMKAKGIKTYELERTLEEMKGQLKGDSV